MRRRDDADAPLPIGDYDADTAQVAATQADGVPRLRVYRPDAPFVVLGRGSQIDRELHVEACLADGMPVLRRSGGGCTVLLDPGNLVVAVTLPSAQLGGNQARFDRLSDWMTAGLAACGCPGVGHDGISDLTLGDRKISGSAIHQQRGVVYYAATLLVDADLAAMERYLRHPPREPGYRKGRRHGDFCVNLAAAFPGITPASLLAGLPSALDIRQLAELLPGG